MTIPAYITTGWDDGHPFDLRLADLLHKYGLPATFYIPLDNKLPVMTRSQVSELSAAFELGGHIVFMGRLECHESKRRQKLDA